MASLDDLVTVGNSVNKNISQLILAINTFASLYNSVIAVANGGTGNSSLTANSVLTGNGTSPIVAEANFVCTDTGDVGIGNSSPSNKLSVTGNANITGNLGVGVTSPSYKLDVSGTGRFSTTVGVGNAAPANTGSGITFPAAQSASSDANTLDDYAENTWTVNFYDAGTGGNASATTTTGYYTKIGRQVTATFLVNNISTAGMTAGNIFYFSLPFTAAAIPFTGSAFADTLNYATGTQLNCYVNNSARASLITSGDNINFANILVSAITSGTTDIYVTITYFT